MQETNLKTRYEFAQPDLLQRRKIRLCISSQRDILVLVPCFGIFLLFSGFAFFPLAASSNTIRVLFQAFANRQVRRWDGMGTVFKPLDHGDLVGKERQARKRNTFFEFV